MALTHVLSVRNDMADIVSNAVDANAAVGKLILKVAGTPASTIPLNDPAFVIPATTDGEAVLIVSPEPTDDGAAGNGSPVDNFDFVDGSDVVVFSGIVPDDLTLTKATIALDDIVKITSFTYKATP